MMHIVSSSMYMKDTLSIHDILSLTTTSPTLTPKITQIKDKEKLSGSVNRWGDKLFLVYEETFED